MLHTLVGEVLTTLRSPAIPFGPEPSAPSPERMELTEKVRRELVKRVSELEQRAGAARRSVESTPSLIGPVHAVIGLLTAVRVVILEAFDDYAALVIERQRDIPRIAAAVEAGKPLRELGRRPETDQERIVLGLSGAQRALANRLTELGFQVNDSEQPPLPPGMLGGQELRDALGVPVEANARFETALTRARKTLRTSAYVESKGGAQRAPKYLYQPSAVKPIADAIVKRHEERRLRDRMSGERKPKK
ncbi:MAG: hypothetical protein ACRCT8_00375 [Lacipirellulaceae bacterium]